MGVKENIAIGDPATVVGDLLPDVNDLLLCEDGFIGQSAAMAFSML